MSGLAAGLVMLTGLCGRAAYRSARAHALRRRLAGRRRLPQVLPPAPARVERWLDRAGVELSPATAWWGWIAALVVLASAAALLAGPPVAALACGALFIAPAIVLRVRRNEGDVRLERGLPDALEAVARSLRSGASLRQAMGEAALVTAGGLGRELAEVARQVSHGATLVAALEALAVRRPLPSVRLAVAALCLGVETGGAQAKAVDGVATTLRDRLGIAAEVQALASQARISGLVIGVAPVAFGAFAVTTDPRTGQFLFHTPVGVALLAAGLSLDTVGWLWMQRLARAPG
jgi:tight adherence protein B